MKELWLNAEPWRQAFGGVLLLAISVGLAHVWRLTKEQRRFSN